ncbi:MAG: DUF4339 domain-containing protein [Treponema sp.]|nr:DUF4339 domain-containing protein [Treponema sp.]
MPIYHIAYSEDDQQHFVGYYELLDLVKQGKLTEETYVWKFGMGKWIQAKKVSELKPLFAVPPPVPDELRKEYALPE